jgi:hypothetical protein
MVNKQAVLRRGLEREFQAFLLLEFRLNHLELDGNYLEFGRNYIELGR